MDLELGTLGIGRVLNWVLLKLETLGTEGVWTWNIENRVELRGSGTWNVGNSVSLGLGRLGTEWVWNWEHWEVGGSRIKNFGNWEGLETSNVGNTGNIEGSVCVFVCVLPIYLLV